MTNAVFTNWMNWKKVYVLSIENRHKKSRMLMTCSQIHADTLTHICVCVCVLFVYNLCFVNSSENSKQIMFILFCCFPAENFIQHSTKEKERKSIIWKTKRAKQIHIEINSTKWFKMYSSWHAIYMNSQFKEQKKR